MAVRNPSPMNDTPGTLTSVAKLLTHPRRQHVLEVLADASSETVPFDELVDEVAAREFEDGDDPANRRQRIANSLHHSDLPKLGELGVLTYETSEQVIHVETDQIEALVDAVSQAHALLGGTE